MRNFFYFISFTLFIVGLGVFLAVFSMYRLELKQWDGYWLEQDASINLNILPERGSSNWPKADLDETSAASIENAVVRSDPEPSCGDRDGRVEVQLAEDSVFTIMRWSDDDYWDPVVDAIIPVPARFVSDFASVPKRVQWLIPSFGRHYSAAIVHDWMYAVGDAGNEHQKSQADLYFYVGLRSAGTDWFRSTLAYLAVKYASKTFGTKSELTCNFFDRDLNIFLEEQIRIEANGYYDLKSVFPDQCIPAKDDLGWYTRKSVITENIEYGEENAFLDKKQETQVNFAGVSSESNAWGGTLKDWYKNNASFSYNANTCLSALADLITGDLVKDEVFQQNPFLYESSSDDASSEQTSVSETSPDWGSGSFYDIEPVPLKFGSTFDPQRTGYLFERAGKFYQQIERMRTLTGAAIDAETLLRAAYDQRVDRSRTCFCDFIRGHALEFNFRNSPDRIRRVVTACEYNTAFSGNSNSAYPYYWWGWEPHDDGSPDIDEKYKWGDRRVDEVCRKELEKPDDYRAIISEDIKRLSAGPTIGPFGEEELPKSRMEIIVFGASQPTPGCVFVPASPYGIEPGGAWVDEETKRKC